MPTAQPRATARAPRRPAPRGSRFAQAARDPRWTAQASAQARAHLTRQAALARRQLAARREAHAAQEAPPRRPVLRRARRGRFVAGLLTPLVIVLALAVLGSAPPVSSQTRPEPGKASIEEMHRLIEVAKEAGLTEEQIKQITIEDEFGNVINAWDYLDQIEKRKQMELARREEELNRVYLTPQDVFSELRQRERADLDNLRERLPFDQERYR